MIEQLLASDSYADDRSLATADLVSIVLTTYRRPAFLERAIDSVLAQSYCCWELIVVDDNEPDSAERQETRQLMACFADDERVRYLEHPENRGGSAARNSGIEAARGEMIAFLDDDDEWLPQKLSAQVAHLSRSGAEVALVYTGFRVVDEAGRRKRERSPRHRGDLYPAIVATNLIGTTSSILCRKEALLEVGLFDESLPGAQDRDLYIRLCQRYQVDFVDAPLVIFNSHDGARITKDKRNKIRAQQMLEEKYDEVLARHPRIHSTFMCSSAKLLARSGDVAAARRVFHQAWRRDPANLEALALWLVSGFGGGAFNALRRSSRSFRKAVLQRLRRR